MAKKKSGAIAEAVTINNGVAIDPATIEKITRHGQGDTGTLRLKNATTYIITAADAKALGEDWSSSEKE